MNRTGRALAVAATMMLLVVAAPRVASAAAAVFFQAGDPSRVTERRTVLALDAAETVWWEQALVDPGAGSYAVVLPVKGTVAIGLSSDALFANFDHAMRLEVLAPAICAGIQPCNAVPDGGPPDAAGSGALPAAPTLLPTETVLLTDAAATISWLATNGLVASPEDELILSAFTAEGFSFLALRFVPDGTTTRMRPIRVITPGLAPTLPLRADAIGAGAAPVRETLFVVAATRQAPTNAPSFVIDPAMLTWDWDTMTSNVGALVAAGVAAGGGQAWWAESSDQLSPLGLPLQLTTLAGTDVVASGYGDATGVGATDAAAADADALLIQGANRTVSLRGELAPAALVQDLLLGASPDQAYLSSVLLAANATGTPPPCDGACDAGVPDAAGASPDAAANPGSEAGCACRAGGRAPAGRRSAFGGALVGAVLLCGAWLLERRRGVTPPSARR